MEEKRMIINFADVTFADVVVEMKQRYPGYNIQTQAAQYIDLMMVVSRHVNTAEQRNKIAAKVMLALLILPAFAARSMN